LLCLTSSSDRKRKFAICSPLCHRAQRAAAQVRARLVEDAGRSKPTQFAISGQLHALASGDRVQFDILLEPSRSAVRRR
jgi:hypothetical protein